MKSDSSEVVALCQALGKQVLVSRQACPLHDGVFGGSADEVP